MAETGWKLKALRVMVYNSRWIKGELASCDEPKDFKVLVSTLTKSNSRLSHGDTGVRVRLFLKTNNPTCYRQLLSATLNNNSSCRLLPLQKIFLDILSLRLTLTGKIKTMKAKALTVLSSAYSQLFCP